MYSTTHRNPTPSSISSISDMSPGLVKLTRLRFITCSPASLLVIPSSWRLPSSITLSRLFHPLVCSVIVTLLNPHHSNSSSRSGSSVPRRLTHTFSLFLIIYLSYPLLYCARVLIVLLFVLDMHVFAGEPIKTVNNISQPTTARSNLYLMMIWSWRKSNNMNSVLQLSHINLLHTLLLSCGPA